MKILRVIIMALSFLMTLPVLAWAEEAAAPAVDTGDTSFILISAAIVLLMTPGLALFYGGLSRKKNVLNTIMCSFIALGIISIQWAFYGYSLSFGPDVGHFIGSLDWLGLKGVGLEPNPDYAATIPHQAFMVFQMVFAIITPAIISGSVAERMRFPAYLAFILLWATFIYDPVAHWVWGVGGWLRNLGALDFAGGTVVHIISGVSALVAAMYVGKRKGYGRELMIPHNLPMTVLGASLLWFGWFGFNAGSSLGAGSLTTMVFVNTQLATAAAMLSWVIFEWIRHGKPTLLGAVSGAVAGLVAITPACGFVTSMSAIIIGFIGGFICFFSVAIMKAKLGYDDSFDAFGVHGMGGTWGAIATGLFASKAANELGNDGVFYGNPDQLVTQLIATAASWAVAVVGTLVLLKVISLFTKLRASDEEQETGLDFTQHGEDAYTEFVSGSPFGVDMTAGGAPVGAEKPAF
ncbi:ammonium transporter [Desulfofarcimen acetoxidans DSM 771]|uniref:Ammonium transporter n=1 Tax=Desulfofarcimen acetoxidans (strain ATCC 49208 / DSM 771 / KCTC 5769 / VKM B-1644 / 5575) TaxID=485916 RepID=C8VVC0_DESAS|nr:ammonium transporter [Desulfofarcimen acetoxidans]ACV60996.1 ammonium transporter [Desulfofarcimen acetoxidans DSM 771]